MGEVVDAVNERGEATFHDVADALGIGPDAARYACNQARREGHLVVVGTQPAKTRPRSLYALNPAPVGSWWQPRAA